MYIHFLHPSLWAASHRVPAPGQGFTIQLGWNRSHLMPSPVCSIHRAWDRPVCTTEAASRTVQEGQKKKPGLDRQFTCPSSPGGKMFVCGGAGIRTQASSLTRLEPVSIEILKNQSLVIRVRWLRSATKLPPYGDPRGLDPRMERKKRKSLFLGGESLLYSFGSFAP